MVDIVLSREFRSTRPKFSLKIMVCLLINWSELKTVVCQTKIYGPPLDKTVWIEGAYLISGTGRDGTGQFRKMCVPNFWDDGTITEILTCLNPGIT